MTAFEISKSRSVYPGYYGYLDASPHDALLEKRQATQADTSEIDW